MRRFALLSLALLTSTPLAAATPDRAWVAVSDQNAKLVAEAQAKFDPESASQNGMTAYDGLATDLGPKLDERNRGGDGQGRR